MRPVSGVLSRAVIAWSWARAVCSLCARVLSRLVMSVVWAVALAVVVFVPVLFVMKLHVWSEVSALLCRPGASGGAAISGASREAAVSGVAWG